MSDHTLSNIFVGRTEECKRISDFLEKSDDSRTLCVHSDGKGGLGKTQLLARVQEEYRKKENVLCTELIDFYLPEVQRPIGLVEKLADQLGCMESSQKIKVYRHGKWRTEEEKKAAEKELVESLMREYRTISSRKKLVIFFFDSYEHIQQVDLEQQCAYATAYSDWVEEELIPILLRHTPNALVILAGRYQSVRLNYQSSLFIKPFEPSISGEYLQKCLYDIGEFDETELKELHRLTQGHSILLALAADWLRHSDEPVSELLVKAKDPGKPFRKELIKDISRKIIINEKDSLLKYVTVAYLRLDADILHHLT